MASFTHPDPHGLRFSDGTFGVFYVGGARPAAFRKTVSHRKRFLTESRQPSIAPEMREYIAAVDAELPDLRGRIAAIEPLLDPGDCSAGLVYPSG